MHKIGIIGGMSWESTAEYYRMINERIAQRLGGMNSARIYISSLNLQEIKDLMDRNDWNEIQRIISGEARKLEEAGSDCIVITSNTIHRVAQGVQDHINVPVLHIADAAGQAIAELGATRVALLGTRATMEGDFLQSRLRARFGIDVDVPDLDDRVIIDDIIFKELVLGKFDDQSRERMVEIIQKLADNGSEATILGCTEIPLLVKPRDTNVPLIDATTAHAHAAADFAMSL